MNISTSARYKDSNSHKKKRAIDQGVSKIDRIKVLICMSVSGRLFNQVLHNVLSQCSEEGAETRA